ncbi:MAG: CotH kinase family protein [Oscillospiraceae bacterium]|jgi:hypothetical protein|nr:CotH kinase family protein [Oscillospiraceae bacterium]
MIKRMIFAILLVIITVTSAALLDLNPLETIANNSYSLVVDDHPSEVQQDLIIPSGYEDEEEYVIIEEDIFLTFSHPNHFYTEAIKVSITSSVPEAVIHFTTDGSEPTIESEIFTSSIEINLPSRRQNERVVPVKAIAVYEDIITRPQVHTYFISPDIHDRFDVLVFSLSTDDRHLFDYHEGIFVPGFERDEYIRQNPREWINPPAPANFNWRGFESERPIYVEVFEADGERVLAQASGVRVHGGWSRAIDQKSMRLVARRSYEPTRGRFNYDFFPGDNIDDGFDSPLLRYDQIILSNGANDRDFAMIRQETNYNLARQAGIRTVSPTRPAAIFLNGEYYGFTWINVRFNEQYFQDVFSAPTQDFQVASRGEWWITTQDEEIIEAIGEFNAFYLKDFRDDNVLRDFEEIADLDDLLRYYAFQTYIGNRDWPGGNLRRWRYTGPQHDEDGEPLNLHPSLDGRWRYILYDLDFTLGLYENPADPRNPSFRDYVRQRGDRYSHMLGALFVRPELVDRYAMYVCDIASNIITEGNMRRAISATYGASYKEIGIALDANKYAGWVSRDTIHENHDNMIHYAAERQHHFFSGMQTHFNWTDGLFTVEVSGGRAIIGTMEAKSSTYFEHLKVPIQPILAKHEVVDHWIVNGKIVNENELIVSRTDASEGVINIELVIRIEYPAFILTNAYQNIDNNGCVLFNPHDEYKHTDGFYLTNNMDEPFMWAIPSANVAPGTSLDFAGRRSIDRTDLHKIRMGFNVRQNRVLFLVNSEGEMLDWIMPTN